MTTGATELENLVLSSIVAAEKIGFLSVASATLVFYDYILTFDQEVSNCTFRSQTQTDTERWIRSSTSGLADGPCPAPCSFLWVLWIKPSGKGAYLRFGAEESLSMSTGNNVSNPSNLLSCGRKLKPSIALAK